MTKGEDLDKTSDATVRDARLSDAADIAQIYNLYVTTSTVSFETEPVSAEMMQARVGEVLDAGYPWLVAEAANRVIGFAYAGPFRPRAAYGKTIETTIYLAPSLKGQGIGRALYTRLFDRVRTLGLHGVISGIALPNDASVALHESFGFTKVAHLPEVGRKFDRWIDVGYWHLALE